MNNIGFYLLVTLLFGFTHTNHRPTSTDVQDNTVQNEDYLYTKQYVESALVTMRAAFYKSDYKLILENVPLLIEKSDSLQLNKVSNDLGSILGNTFVQLEEFEQAEKIFNERLAAAISEKDTSKILTAYINLGSTYITIDPPKALSYLEEGIAVKNAQSNDTSGQLLEFILHINLAELYVGKNNLTKAEYHIEKALSLSNQSSDKNRNDEALAAIYYLKGEIALVQKKFEEAIKYCNRSLEIGKTTLHENYLIGNYKHLAMAYESTGQLEELKETRKKYDSLRDKRYEDQKIRQQQIAKIKYDVEKYKQEARSSQLETELASQKASRTKILFIASCLVGFALFLMILLLLNGRKKKMLLLDSLKKKNRQYLKAKEESEQLAESKTALLSTISHELRTPLYGIVGLTSVFLESPALDEQKDDLLSLKFSADYLLALVNDVLHLNKLASNEGRTLKNAPFNLQSIVQGTVQSSEFINKKNHNTVELQIDRHIPKVLIGDKTKISQVLMNLISNASKFTEHGIIKVIITEVFRSNTHSTLRFLISDTGIGIPKKQQKKIFEEFSQVNTLEGKGGTGLGLSIVKKVLDILNAKLNLKSKVGKGTEFSFDLILGIHDDEVLQTPSKESDKSQLKGKHILIVDDNRINQIVTKKVLETFSLEHKTASNGMEALQLVQEHVFDMILMDINMPIMNGKQASEKIRELGIGTPIIALSATDYADGDNDLLIHGINDCLVKPYENEQLLEKLLTYM